MKFIYEQSIHELFTPCDVIWVKESGEELVISKKDEVMNHALIAKLVAAKKELICRQFEDDKLKKQIIAWFKNSERELSLKSKLVYREKILKAFYEGYVVKGVSQFKIDTLGIELFSDFSLEEMMSFAKKDLSFFKRSLSLVSSFILLRYIVGHYNETELRLEFRKQLADLMSIEETCSLVKFRMNLEKSLMNESFEIDESRLSFNLSLLFEKESQKGLKKYSTNELQLTSELMIISNQYLSFNSFKQKNILSAICNNDLQSTFKASNLIKNIFYKFQEHEKMELGKVG